LEPLRIDIDEPRELRDADDALVRQIGDMRPADDRRDMMLAMALETDVLQDDHLVVAIGLFEGALELLDRIGLIAGEKFLVSACHATGRAAQALPRRIIAGPAQQNAHRLFGLFAGRPARRHKVRGSAFAR